MAYRFLLAAAVVAIVAVVAGQVAVLLDPATTELDQGVWWAFLRLTDPGYLGDDEGVARRAISTIVTVLGYVLFLGLLIAILTQWLTNTIAKLESGVTPVAISDHVIILGWTAQVPEIVSELLRTGGRLERFLEREGARQLRIVILAEHVDTALVQTLREQLGTLWNDRQVLLRSGSPLRLEHLERVAFRDAAALILPGADFGERNPEAVDAQTIKTLLSVATHAGAPGANPLAVAALYEGQKASVARRAYSGDCEVVAIDTIVSGLIGQSVWQRGLCDVWTELLTLNEGNAIHVRAARGEVGAAFAELRGVWPKAILLGAVRPGEHRVLLAPPPETALVEGDALVFLARDFDDCAPVAARAAPLAARPTPAQPEPVHARRVLILGWSRKVPSLLRELARQGSGAVEVDVVSLVPLAERERMLARVPSEDTNARVRHIEAGFTLPTVLERLDPRRYDHVLLLASERLAEEDQADATTVTASLMLKRLLQEEGPRPEVFVELTGEDNRFLFENGGDDVLVSSTVASYLLSQVALARELAAVYTDLSGVDSARFALVDAGQLPIAGRPARFEELTELAAARGEIALGVRRGGELALNPDRETEWTLGPGDQLVVLAPRTAGGGA